MCRGLDSLPSTCLERAKELKALFGSLLQKSDHSITGTGQSKKCNKLRLNINEPLKWKESFENLLSSQSKNNPQHHSCSMLILSFSCFQMDCACSEHSSSLTKPAKLATKAKRIYDEFIRTDAPREVNLDHVTKAIIKENMEHPSQSCFDLAQSKIYTLMEKDCYPRFLKCPTYLELSRQTKTG
uniref:Regulator of G protein signaling 5b n=1 Tax=Scophthalmus maximus TaxID=52904 RepID=A0A8D3D8P1_SCOMX